VLGLGGHLESQDRQGSVDQADAETDQQPADQSDPDRNCRDEEHAYRHCADSDERAADDGQNLTLARIVYACLCDSAQRPRDRPECDPPGGRSLGPPVHSLQDEGNHDSESDLRGQGT